MKSEENIIQEINNIKEIQKDILNILDALIKRLNECELTLSGINNDLNRIDSYLDNLN